MKTLLLLACLILIGVSLQAQPYVYGYSYVTCDPGSGGCQAYGATSMIDPDEFVEFKTATASLTFFGFGGDYETDNCGDGCAQALAYGKVFQLGVNYSETTWHYGASYDPDFNSFQQAFYDGDTYRVPPAPNIQLQSIDAVNPRGVRWTYNVFGAPLFTQTFQLGSIYIASNGTLFTTDQVSYPSGNNPASFVGYAYGIPIQGPICYVNRADNVGDGYHSWTQPITDGQGFVYPASHITAELATTISYCTPPAGGQGALTVAAIDVTGSIDTSQAPYYATSTITDIHEDFQSGSVDFGLLGPETRPTMPPQGPQFQSRDTQYAYTLWFYSGAPTAICNTYLLIGASVDNTLYTVSPPLLCSNNYHAIY